MSPAVDLFLPFLARKGAGGMVETAVGLRPTRLAMRSKAKSPLRAEGARPGMLSAMSAALITPALLMR